jgi:hypothetical protein
MAIRLDLSDAVPDLDINPERMIADTAYGTGQLLDWLFQERGIAPQIPVVDKSGRTSPKMLMLTSTSVRVARNSNKGAMFL